MPISDYFAADYLGARAKFRESALSARATLSQHLLPDHTGPSGEDLTVDVAVLGPDSAECALILVSGTHGVEGFCGSGCQVGFFRDELVGAFRQPTRVIAVHSLNPFGFAWLRRTNEDNVDLNRNFQDFSQPLPSSEAYDALHPLLVPNDWDGEARRRAEDGLMIQIKNLGMQAVQAALQRGQYPKPDGLFYGGAAESWSAKTFREILRAELPGGVRHVACIDIHTGLGATGYGEPIHLGDSAESIERAKRFFGPEVKATTPQSASHQGSVSAPVTGPLLAAIRPIVRTAEITAIALEFGTLPILDVLTALRADNWLHAVAKGNSPLRDQIKQQIRSAFHVENAFWKAAVYGRAADLIVRAARELNKPFP